MAKEMQYRKWAGQILCLAPLLLYILSAIFYVYSGAAKDIPASSAFFGILTIPLFFALVGVVCSGTVLWGIIALISIISYIFVRQEPKKLPFWIFAISWTAICFVPNLLVVTEVCTWIK